MRLGTGLPAAEETGEEAASASRTAGELVLQLLDAALGGAQRLLLHHDGLGHVVGGVRLPRDLRADELRRLRVRGSGLALDLRNLAEELLDGLTVLMVHDKSIPFCNGQRLLFPLAGEAQQQLEEVDEVQVERERAEHGHLAGGLVTEALGILFLDRSACRRRSGP